ncbi:hypothetical protein [Oryza sativa Japonica Group]|uniref:Uncharacterized protein n=1 Tax=Oryza sativa subsp. japonica TaxID=39947 RepID=Q5ZD73_ORYSJ|nr:hypothetical protein [Oryza sativa Japonica Group]BAD61342.1 hypothetical protein [Oryza sativa Japonica Group]
MWAARHGTAQARPCLGRGLSGRHGPTDAPGRAVPAHSPYFMYRAWPAGPSCRAGPTVPGQPSVPVGRPRHGPTVGPGQHGPDPSRAVPCLGRAKKACRGPGLRASGLMANYSYWSCILEVK